MKRSRAFLRHRRGNLDANHVSIRDGLRKLGYFVVDTAGVGGGCPDLAVAAHRQRVISGVGYVLPLGWTWLELKTRKGRERDSQVRWRQDAEARGVRVAVCRTLEDCLEALK